MSGSNKSITFLPRASSESQSPFGHKKKKVFLLLVVAIFLNLLVVLSIFNSYFADQNTRHRDDFKHTTPSMEGEDRHQDSLEADSSLQIDVVELQMSTMIDTSSETSFANSTVLALNSTQSASKNTEADVIDPGIRPYETIGSTKLANCGRRLIVNENFTEVPKINTYFGQFPWMVMLLYYNNKGSPAYMGGASLIAPNIVLTAAHKVQYAVDYLIHAGDWYAEGKLKEEYLPIESRDVVNISIHPGFNIQTLENDIALLKLDFDIKYTEHIQPVCLADWFVHVDPDRCILIGWGTDEPADSVTRKLAKNNKYLRQVGYSLLERGQCEEVLQKSDMAFRYYNVPYGTMCAWNTSSPLKSCARDGGGPLICPSKENPDQYVQVGINIWTDVHCDPAQPDVFTNIEAYWDWMEPILTEWKSS